MHLIPQKGIDLYFKTKVLEEQFNVLEGKNKQLYEMALTLASLSTEEWGIAPVVTSLYRGKDHPLYNPGSVHAHWRGIDFRGRTYDQAQLDYIEAYFCSTYQYDPRRPLMAPILIHGDGLNMHIHLQNFPGKTVLIRN